MDNVAVVGAAGHVGIPFSLVVADAGYTVHGIDVDPEACEKLNRGVLPFIEEAAQPILDRCLAAGTLRFTTDFAVLSVCDVIAITIGTPVDGEGNPRFDALLSFVDDHLIPRLTRGAQQGPPLIILRSTVSPGTTELLRRKIEDVTRGEEGQDFFLTFCPERVAQTKGVVETRKLPQLLGAFSDLAFQRAARFFSPFIDNELFHLTPREAEVAKLITNMYRYVTFALSNEFYMLGEHHGVNVDKIIGACNFDYPRMNLPYPGPNVGGPCLYKDGKFLLADVQFPELIQTSFLINEGMPAFVFEKVRQLLPEIETLGILGMTFKANCDDTRHSLSFKLAKIAALHGVRVREYDPLWSDPSARANARQLGEVCQSDAVVLMTPHAEFAGLGRSDFPEETLIVDVWKFWGRSKGTINGFYFNGVVE